jgi:outer membrane protein assembly factor BamC
LDLPYDRAWASLGRALEKAAFEITDLDRSSGIYYVRFLGQAKEDKQSWWASLWNSDEMQPMVGQAFVVTVQKLTEQSVSIRLRPQDESVVFENREDEDLLAMIKGNID